MEEMWQAMEEEKRVTTQHLAYATDAVQLPLIPLIRFCICLTLGVKIVRRMPTKIVFKSRSKLLARGWQTLRCSDSACNTDGTFLAGCSKSRVLGIFSATSGPEDHCQR